ncbi:MAG: PHB depolymerase family esterase [Desulfobacterales bacterium]
MRDARGLLRGLLAALCAVASGWVAAGCHGSLPDRPPIEPGNYREKLDLRAGGFRRAFSVHVPAGFDGQRPLPLVVVIHGAFDTAAGMEKASGFSRLADREHFFVLYPEGMNLFGFLSHWNAGHCCGKAAEDGVDDVGFLAAAVERVCQRLPVDQTRIYMVGFSNGGMLTYRFAAERGDMLAAAATLGASAGGTPAAGVPPWRIPEPVAAIPILSIHGLADDFVPFAGGASPARGGERTYLSVPDSLAVFIERDGCRRRTDQPALYGGRIHRTAWLDENGAEAVVLYGIAGWGHVWPGPAFTRTMPEGKGIETFDAAAVVWDFFKIHRRSR